MSSAGARTPAARQVVNAMTVDVEDYFHVSVFERFVSRDRWDSMESRVCRNTDRLLEMFDEKNVKATFFVLGWVAERFDGLVKRIAAAGHEVASHGYEHRLIYNQTPAAFRDDVRRAKSLLEDLSGQSVSGFRAPSYSVTAQTLWAIDVLIEEGHTYDASVFPIHHDRYGIPWSPRHPYVITGDHGTLVEMPGSTVRFAGLNFPVGGGGYFRLLPYAWTQWGIARINRTEERPAIFYLHPWEIDPDQPRLHADLIGRFRHYTNLARTESRLRSLLSRFRFGPLSNLVDSQAPATAISFLARPLPHLR
jgi:polysaccharide deacetylase family protein (PEP-CTERM system associated)